MPEIIDLLRELRDYMDNRADCDVQGDPPEEIPNTEMRLLCRIQETLEKLEEK